MWKASIIKKEIRNGNYHVTVGYTDGEHVVDEVYRSYTPTEKWITTQAYNRIEQLKQAYSIDLPEGELSLTRPDSPKVDETAEAFVKAIRLLKEAQHLIQMGVVSPEDTAVVNAKNTVKNGWSKYCDLL